MIDNLYNVEIKPDLQESEYKYEGTIPVEYTTAVRSVEKPDSLNVYTPQQKADAASLYGLYGSINEVSKRLGIPYKTVYSWKKSPEWIDLSKQVISEKRAKFTARINDILDQTILEIEDRLTNGDQTYNPKTGEITRKPVEARVLSSIFETLANHKKYLENIPRQEEAKILISERLQSLEAAFIRFSQAKEIILTDYSIQEE